MSGVFENVAGFAALFSAVANYLLFARDSDTIDKAIDALDREGTRMAGNMQSVTDLLKTSQEQLDRSFGLMETVIEYLMGQK